MSYTDIYVAVLVLRYMGTDETTLLASIRRNMCFFCFCVGSDFNHCGVIEVAVAAMNISTANGIQCIHRLSDLVCS